MLLKSVTRMLPTLTRPVTHIYITRSGVNVNDIHVCVHVNAQKRTHTEQKRTHKEQKRTHTEQKRTHTEQKRAHKEHHKHTRTPSL